MELIEYCKDKNRFVNYKFILFFLYFLNMKKTTYPRFELITKLIDKVNGQNNQALQNFFNNQSDKTLYEMCFNDGLLGLPESAHDKEEREKIRDENRKKGRKKIKLDIEDIVKVLIDNMKHFALPKNLKCIDANGWERFDILTCKVRVNQFNDIQQWTNMNVYCFLFVIKRLQKIYQDTQRNIDDKGITFYDFLRQHSILLNVLTIDKLIKLLCLIDYKYIFSQNQISWIDLSKYAKNIHEYLQNNQRENLILMKGPLERDIKQNQEAIKNMNIVTK